MAYYPNDILTPHFLTGAIEERPDRESMKQRYIGLEFFPWRQVPARRLTWDSVASENNLAGFYGPKGEPIPGDDVLFNSHFADMIDVMATRQLDQEVIDSVRAPGMLAVFSEGGSAFPIQGLRQRFEDHIRKSLGWCDDAVDAQVEYMAMSALQGTVTWPPTTAVGGVITPPMPHWNSKQAISINFPIPATFNQSASTLTGYSARGGNGVWTDLTNADPVDDLELIAELMVETYGINADDMEVVMSRSTFSKIARMTKVIQSVRGILYESPTGSKYVSMADLKDFILTNLGFTIRLYDAQWTYRTNLEEAPPTVTRVKFLKEGKVLIVPSATKRTLGYMANCYHKDGTGQFTYGKYTWLHEDDEPPFGLRLGEGIVSWPIMEQPSSIFCLDSYS